MAVNKVDYGDKTLIDISDSTVTPETLGKDAVAYGANGDRIVGTMEAGSGSFDTCTVQISAYSQVISLIIATCVVDGQIIARVPVGTTVSSSYAQSATIENVLCGSALYIMSCQTLVGWMTDNSERLRKSETDTYLRNDWGTFKITAPAGGMATIDIYSAD